MLLYILGHARKSAGLLFKDKSSAAEKGSIAAIVRKKNPCEIEACVRIMVASNEAEPGVCKKFGS
jgi:hypothetical protein